MSRWKWVAVKLAAFAPLIMVMHGAPLWQRVIVILCGVQLHLLGWAEGRATRGAQEES